MGPDRQILMAFCPLFTYGAIEADFDGILPPCHLWGPLRQILMAFPPYLTYWVHTGRFWWHFFPFWPMGPIEADFDGIFPLFTYGAHWGRFWWHFAPASLMGPDRQILIFFYFFCGRLRGIFWASSLFLWGRSHWWASIWWHFAPFCLMGPIKADFDGIFSPFWLIGPVSESMFESAALSFRCSRIFPVVFINFLSSLLKPFLCSFGERKN